MVFFIITGNARYSNLYGDRIAPIYFFLFFGNAEIFQTECADAAGLHLEWHAPKWGWATNGRLGTVVRLLLLPFFCFPPHLFAPLCSDFLLSREFDLGVSTHDTPTVQWPHSQLVCLGVESLIVFSRKQAFLPPPVHSFPRK